ncbi:thermopsin family protease [Sulfolobus tengchongensis]|uniref:Thermopsin family protease n=1 Tax=Sulfolobus tengchongensis TaxID=207809 RepID=A0AAX4L5B2_9CREN
MIIFPLASYLLINESYNSSGILVDFSYLVVQNGSDILPPELVTYDKAFIKINDVKNTFIIINDSTTPKVKIGNYYYWSGYLDAELVWGGFAYGEHTTFTNMSSYLALYYYNSESGKFIPFPIVYSYGNDTAESADNLHVTISPSGYAYVTLGNLQPGLLTTQFNPALPSFTFLSITCLIPFYINGSLTHNFEGYIKYSTYISFLRNFSANSSAFAVFNGKNLTIYPSEKITFYQIKPNYTWYYLVYINSTYPVYINGIETNKMFVRSGETI